MKQKRHTPEQIIAKLREAEAVLSAGGTISQVVSRFQTCFKFDAGGTDTGE